MPYNCLHFKYMLFFFQEKFIQNAFIDPMPAMENEQKYYNIIKLSFQIVKHTTNFSIHELVVFGL